MITYFNLHRPYSERLMADTEIDEETEYKACPLTIKHNDGDRRISQLALSLKHNRRDEALIWCWVEGLVVHQDVLHGFKQQGFTGYRTRAATVRFKDGKLSNDRVWCESEKVVSRLSLEKLHWNHELREVDRLEPMDWR